MNAKRCEICEIRPIMSSVERNARGGFPYCSQCLTKEEWENQHSDDGHEFADDLKFYAGLMLPSIEAKDEYMASMREDMKRCWICNPELDQTAEEYVQRTGTSRQGMKLHVPPRASGKEKAKATAAQLPQKYATSISVRQGFVTLKAASELGCGFKISWNQQGQLVAATQTTSGKTKKIRNVAEALRLA